MEQTVVPHSFLLGACGLTISLKMADCENMMMDGGDDDSDAASVHSAISNPSDFEEDEEANMLHWAVK